MSEIHPNKWAWQLQIKPIAKLILLAFTDYINPKKQEYCWPSIEDLMQKCELGRTAVIENLKYLISHKLILVEKRYTNGVRKSNIYRLNLAINPILFNQQIDQIIPEKEEGISPDSVRMDYERTESERTDGGERKSGLRTTVSPDNVPINNEFNYPYELPNNELPNLLSLPSEVTQKNKNLTHSKFEQFWKIYPRKKKKKKAFEIWQRKKIDNAFDKNTGELIFEKIMNDIPRRILEDKEWLDGWVSHPTTYLNGELWNDEIISPQQSQAPPKFLTREEKSELAFQEHMKKIRAERESESENDAQE